MNRIAPSRVRRKLNSRAVRAGMQLLFYAIIAKAIAAGMKR